jgi:hypothetical protein
MDKPQPKRVRLSGQSRGKSCNVTVDELLQEEIDIMEAWTLGTCWLRVSDDGRLEQKARFAELPSPIQDPKIPPAWVHKTDWTKEAPFLYNTDPPLPEDDPDVKHCDPSITIRSLCGYSNTPYEYEARKLQSYGFECLRSRRGTDGRFWELWYLPGQWFAKGELKEAIDKVEGSPEKVKEMVRFLCRYVSFGALDVCYQRACMVID